MMNQGPRPAKGTEPGAAADQARPPCKMIARDLVVHYGPKKALGPVSLEMPEKHVTALIGPSGCGKSTFLRSLNRMNELIPGCRVEGDVRLDEQPIYGPHIDPVSVRRRVVPARLLRQRR